MGEQSESKETSLASIAKQKIIFSKALIESPLHRKRFSCSNNLGGKKLNKWKQNVAGEYEGNFTFPY